MPALNLNRVLADLNRGSNSLNSISAIVNYQVLNYKIEIFRPIKRQKHVCRYAPPFLKRKQN